jgi:hypothetical protein
VPLARRPVCSLPLFSGLGFLIAYCQDCAGSRIYVMNLCAHCADNWLVGVGVLRHIIGGKALNSMSGLVDSDIRKVALQSPALDRAEGATPGSSA